MFQTPPDETRDAVRAALDSGYRHLDTAAAYGNAREVGEAVRASDLNRSEVFLETKSWISDSGYDEFAGMKVDRSVFDNYPAGSSSVHIPSGELEVVFL